MLVSVFVETKVALVWYVPEILILLGIDLWLAYYFLKNPPINDKRMVKPQAL